ncbi:MAG TPA: dihydroorotate dehydrogenase (quinone) [Anaerolineaceae bacterium]|nr:dihydroorotate dehydrogenase (quinone) [Anaerolineaceae bacterium]
MRMYKSLRPLIFMNDPEQAHHATINLLALGGSLALGRGVIRAMFPIPHNGPEVRAFGLTFPNPLGMAAGYDKEGTAWRGLACLGFGHIEVGTVTPRPQPGNPKPRVFRLIEDEAVINRMGFPGRGAEVMLRHLNHPKPKGLVLGVNIGKNKSTPLEIAAGDYVNLVRAFAAKADYLAVNISSPNTPGLRTLQKRAALEALLNPIAAERSAQAKALDKPVPVLVKLAPDLSDEELDAALEAIQSAGMDGVIIGNTTIRRVGLASPKSFEEGGLSGKPLNDLNTAMIKKVYARTCGALPIIASGGVMCAADAQCKLDEGAVLVQLYTGLIYEGPGLVCKILNTGLNHTK